jgi:uncharacterized protein
MTADTLSAKIEAATARPSVAEPVGSGAFFSNEAGKRKRSGRAIFLTWLRKIHLYVGLWGAVLGLLFGASGILLNHRAILKIPVEKTVQTTAQLPLPAHGFASPEQLSTWLQQELKFSSVAPALVKRHPAKEVIWSDQTLTQPERWTVALNQPGRGISAEYFVGNQFVKLEQIDATPIGTLTRLHMSVGVSAFWVLLADTIAGSLILLSLTGLLLWTQLHTIRTVAVMTSVGALLAGLWFMWSI